MPSPLLHAAVGASLGQVDRHHEAGRWYRWKLLAVAIVCATLADFDLLVGLLLYDVPAKFHGMYSHSLGAAVIAATVVAVIGGRGRWRLAGWAFVAWFGSVALDGFVPDGREPYGIPLWWPITPVERTYLGPPIFLGVKHGMSDTTTAEMIDNLLTWYHVRVVAVEAAVGLGLFAVCRWLGRRRRPATDAEA